MIFQFHYSRTLLGFLIRLFSFGRFNHVSIRLGNYVYEATTTRGVIRTLYTKWDSSTVATIKEVPLTQDEYQRVYIWLNRQIGKGYDIWGIFSFIFFWLPPRKGYWYCSELAICALAKAKDKTDQIQNQKVSPQLFFDILDLVV
jgi:uncharacterized protein YycO